MDKPIIIGAAGYPSIDRILRLGAPVEVGKTSVIANDDYNTPSYGGCCVNICYVLAKLGVETMPFMNVGEDFSSSGYRAFLQVPRLSLAATKVVPGVNTSASVLLEDPGGDHVTLFYEGAMRGGLSVFDREDAVEKIDLGVVTVGSLDYNMGFLHALLEQGKEAAFSMKFDPHAFPEAQLREFLRSSAYIFMNESEAANICRLLGWQNVERLFQTGRQKCVVVTKGKEGCEVFSRDGGRIRGLAVGPAKERRTADHAGVGDAFVAGFLYGVTQGADYVRCAQLGAATASFVLEQKGCLNGAPTLEQVLARERENY